MITTILWDVDGTLLDFAAAEKAAIRNLFEEYHLGECTDEMLLRYSRINKTYWERDVDGTLLDFAAAEKAAIRNLFEEYHLGECTDEMLLRYSRINKTYWERLERGEITKAEVLVGRFQEFFEAEGIDSAIALEFNQKYQIC